MRYHHNELNYKRSLVMDDWSMEDIQEYEDVSKYDDLDNIEENTEVSKSSVRRRLDDYLESKRAREQDVDPFDEDYYYDD